MHYIYIYEYELVLVVVVVVVVYVQECIVCPYAYQPEYAYVSRLVG